LLFAGCYAPSFIDGQYLCPDKHCPGGQICSPCGVCMNPDDPSTDGVGCPGCALGDRSLGDPRLAEVAFCDAAWRVPGISTDTSASLATPCDRSPGADGLSAVDDATTCSVEDACASGWHVCLDEQDVVDRGMTTSDCTSVDMQTGAFWATREAATEKNDAPPICGSSGTARIIGCGSLYSASLTPVTCSVLARYIGEITGTATVTAWDCMSKSDGIWQCGMDGKEALSVIKTTAQGGGVLCCRDQI
jgi:hypothetical protein